MSRLGTDQPVDLVLPVPEDINTRSRFHYLQRPQLAPGCCAICGSGKRPVVDFQMQVEFYGAVYFCVECIVSAASITGEMVPKAQFEVLANAYSELLESINTRKEQINEYLGRCDENLSRLISDLAAPVSGDVSVDADSPEEDAGIKQSVSEGSDEFTPAVDKPLVDQGPFSVPDGSSSKSAFTL